MYFVVVILTKWSINGRPLWFSASLGCPFLAVNFIFCWYKFHPGLRDWCFWELCMHGVEQVCLCAERFTYLFSNITMCPCLEGKNLYGGYLHFYTFYFKMSVLIDFFLRFVPCGTCLNVTRSSKKCENLIQNDDGNQVVAFERIFSEATEETCRTYM